MKRHIQQVVGNARGSCFATSIACVLDLDLEAVPNFVLFGDGSWCTALAMWCIEQKIHARHVYRADLVAPGVAAVASGVGPRFREDGVTPIRHAVVWLDGSMAHDPHPSGAGLIAPPESWWIFERCGAGGCESCGTVGMTRGDWSRAWRLYNEDAVARSEALYGAREVVS